MSFSLRRRAEVKSYVARLWNRPLIVGIHSAAKKDVFILDITSVDFLQMEASRVDIMNRTRLIERKDLTVEELLTASPVFLEFLQFCGDES